MTEARCTKIDLVLSRDGDDLTDGRRGQEGHLCWDWMGKTAVIRKNEELLTIRYCSRALVSVR